MLEGKPKCYRCKHKFSDHQDETPRCKYSYSCPFYHDGIEDTYTSKCECPGYAESKEQAVLMRSTLLQFVAPDPVSSVFGSSTRNKILDILVCSEGIELSTDELAGSLEMPRGELEPILDSLVKENLAVLTLMGYGFNGGSAEGKMIKEAHKVQMKKWHEEQSKITFDEWFHEFYGEFIKMAEGAASRRIRREGKRYYVDLLDSEGKIIRFADVADGQSLRKLASILNIEYDFEDTI